MLCSVLREDHIKKIHEASLVILERVGVEIPHETVLSMFADADARVDFTQKRVKIPNELVLKLIDRARKSFSLYGRDLERKALFGQGRRNYNSSAGQANWIESPGEGRNYATLENVSNAAKFAEALDCINIVGAMADPHELPVSWRAVAVLAELIKNTTKPVTFWFSDRASTKYIVDMIVEIRGNERKARKYPICYPLLEPISPLKFPYHGVDLLFETRRIGLPVTIGPMAQMGLSAPCTIAGVMAQQNAEILAGICISQLIQPGTAVCYGGICHAFDMASTQLIFAGPEQALFGVAMTQMGKYYGFPVYVNSGLTDSKTVDAQAGIEAAATLATSAAAGADIFGHFGISGADQAGSLDFLVMQNELISYVESMLRDIDFSTEAFALTDIEHVDSITTFLETEHTKKHFRKELWFPRLLDRNYFQTWYNDGRRTLQDRCEQEKVRIFSSLNPAPISEKLAKSIDGILAEAKHLH